MCWRNIKKNFFENWMKKEKKKWKILDHKEYLNDDENEHKEGDVLN